MSDFRFHMNVALFAATLSGAFAANGHVIWAVLAFITAVAHSARCVLIYEQLEEQASDISDRRPPTPGV